MVTHEVSSEVDHQVLGWVSNFVLLETRLHINKQLSEERFEKWRVALSPTLDGLREL
jgi:hypothetical protein